MAYLQQNFQVDFFIAKTRVSPIKTLTLPQLESMAPLVVTRVDIQIVLHWLCCANVLNAAQEDVMSSNIT